MKFRALALSLLVANAHAADAAGASLCTAGERTLFSCPAGRKVISVCDAAGATSTQFKPEYRYGTRTRTDLRLTHATANHQLQVAASPIVLSGGGGTSLRFRQGEHDYVVYSATSARLGDKSGVLVSKSGKRIANVRCTSDPAPDLDLDELQRGGIANDPEIFELP